MDVFDQDRVILTKHNLYTYLKGCPLKTERAIDQAPAPFQEGHFFSTKFKLGQWDGRIHLFHKKFKSFPAGLLEKVIRILCQKEMVFPREVVERFNSGRFCVQCSSCHGCQ